MSEGTVVTFYSYKGGVGRTLALANVAALLAAWGYRVLCIDWDIEAPGLHLYFQRWMNKVTLPGLVELIEAYANGTTPTWGDYLTSVKLPDINQPISFISAGAQDKNYVKRMQNIKWDDLYNDHNLGVFIESMRIEWKSEYDFILIDSRTGVTDTSGICTVHLPDLLVLLFTPNEQSLKGALDVVKRARHSRNKLPFDRSKLLVLPIATRFELRVQYEMAQEWLQRFTRELRPLYSEWAHRTVKIPDLINFTRVPYVPYWSFGEKLPVIEAGTKDLEDIGYSLETVSALIAQHLSSIDLLVRNREAYVSAARRGPSRDVNGSRNGASHPSPHPIQVFISYSYRDKVLFDELVKHLSILQRQGYIDIWSDRQITAGSDWRDEIDARMEEADLILLLVSPDYLASDYDSGIEMQQALERHETGKARVIPIILRPASWIGAPFGKLIALPRDAKPVTLWTNREEAWANIAEAIRQLTITLAQKKTSAG